MYKDSNSNDALLSKFDQLSGVIHELVQATQSQDMTIMMDGNKVGQILDRAGLTGPNPTTSTNPNGSVNRSATQTVNPGLPGR